MPQVIATGETITVPAGRVAVLPNVQVDGELVVDGEVFIPSGSSFSKVVETEGNQSIDGVKTFSSSPIVPTPTTEDSSTKVATTSFVNNKIINITYTKTEVDNSVDALKDVLQNAKTEAYTLALTDRGKSIDTSAGVTVPLNSTVAFPIGTVITITNTSAAAITLTQTAGVTLRQAGTANTGNRTLAAYGMATLRKVASDTWFISGAGLS